MVSKWCYNNWKYKCIQHIVLSFWFSYTIITSNLLHTKRNAKLLYYVLKEHDNSTRKSHQRWSLGQIQNSSLFHIEKNAKRMPSFSTMCPKCTIIQGENRTKVKVRTITEWNQESLHEDDSNTKEVFPNYMVGCATLKLLLEITMELFDSSLIVIWVFFCSLLRFFKPMLRQFSLRDLTVKLNENIQI